jgi:L-aspartate oxidase
VLNVFDQRRYLIPFRSLLLPHIITDTLVIGGGVAGARAAVEASRHGSVIVVSKDKLEISSTAAAQGGIAAVMAAGDSFDEHVNDTMAAGAGLCNEPAVRAAIEEAPAEIERLITWGMRFDRNASGEIAYGREGGHSRNRILHSDGDATGAELARCLADQLRKSEQLRIFEHCFVLDLLTAPGNGRSDSRVLGAITHHPRYGLQLIWAKATILAAGGAGQVYRETTNPKVATGDGLAMAYRAGAVIADVEFMQFHPTTLYIAGATRALITEAVRGEGAYLVDRNGRRFMPEYHEQAELAPRDIVSRAIIDQIARTGEPCVYLDARHLDHKTFAARFPSLVNLLRGFDLSPGMSLIPVRPCAHYAIGGAWTDLEGRTSLPGLYACGESACNGLHGANRLASNSLLDGLVFGRRAGAACKEMMNAPTGPINIISDIRIADTGELDVHDVRSSLRSAMWRNVGIERTGSKLADAVDMFDFWGRYTLDKIFDEPNGWATQNMLTVAALMTRAASWRRETRGVHWRLDYPASETALAAHALWSIGADQPSLRPATIQERVHA